jgi:hypothetical protein
MSRAKLPAPCPEVEDLIRRASNIARIAPELSERDIRGLAESFAEDLEELLLEARAKGRPPAKVINLSEWQARRAG